MPTIGRPRLTPEQLAARIADYCRTYGLPLSPDFPPFPSGRRETDQHREWLKLYKARARIVQHENQRAALDQAPLEDRQALAASQDGRCPICTEGIDLHGPLDVREPRGAAIVHARCQEAASLVVTLGPEGLERLRAYLWPRAKRPRSERP